MGFIATSSENKTDMTSTELVKQAIGVVMDDQKDKADGSNELALSHLHTALHYLEGRDEMKELVAARAAADLARFKKEAAAEGKTYASDNAE